MVDFWKELAKLAFIMFLFFSIGLLPNVDNWCNIGGLVFGKSLFIIRCLKTSPYQGASCLFPILSLPKTVFSQDCLFTRLSLPKIAFITISDSFEF